jgi:hypothetical protein
MATGWGANDGEDTTSPDIAFVEHSLQIRRAANHWLTGTASVEKAQLPAVDVTSAPTT